MQRRQMLIYKMILTESSEIAFQDSFGLETKLFVELLLDGIIGFDAEIDSGDSVSPKPLHY